MRYLGGKTQMGKEISEVLKKYAPPDKFNCYIEPFCGSLGVTVHMVDDYKCYISDFNKDLILLWKGIKSKTFKYPRHVSKKTYMKYKVDKPSAMRAFVGFGCSFSGKWFGGYVDTYNANNTEISMCEVSVRSIKKMEESIRKLKGIKQCSYEKYSTSKLKKCLIYCDPPYQDTTKYDAVESFDSHKFWDTMRAWSKHNIVIISEFKAPKDFKCIWKKDRIVRIFQKSTIKTEKLFIHKSILEALKLQKQRSKRK